MKSLDPKALEAASRAFRRMHNSVCYPSASENEANWAASEIVSAYLAALDANTNPASSDLSSLREGDGTTYPRLSSLRKDAVGPAVSEGGRGHSAPVTSGAEVAVKPVVWEKYWGGSNDDIPSWRASTPVGLTLDVDFAGERLEKHSDADPVRLAAKQAEAFAWYETRIRSALVSGSREEG